jgi:hypothetical protein
MKNLIALLLSALTTVLAHGTAIAQTDFYRGKTITFHHQHGRGRCQRSLGARVDTQSG